MSRSGGTVLLFDVLAQEATVGGAVTSGWTWTCSGSPLNSTGSRPKSARTSLDDLLRALQVARGEHPVPVVGGGNQVGLADDDTVPAGADVLYSAVKRNYDRGMRLRYNYRLYPTAGQRDALARAFGCARVVFNDGLRARQEAHAAGLPYLTDRELSPG